MKHEKIEMVELARWPRKTEFHGPRYRNVWHITLKCPVCQASKSIPQNPNRGKRFYCEGRSDT